MHSICPVEFMTMTGLIVFFVVVCNRCGTTIKDSDKWWDTERPDQYIFNKVVVVMMVVEWQVKMIGQSIESDRVQQQGREQC